MSPPIEHLNHLVETLLGRHGRVVRVESRFRSFWAFEIGDFALDFHRI
jgi:hypothetical protein